jgi:hypothetical protein
MIRMKPTRMQGKNGQRLYQKHQLTPVLKALKRRGIGAIDRRTSLAKATTKLRSELVADLGGEQDLSVQQGRIVDEFVKRFVMLESIDAWIFRQPSLLNKRTRSLYPIVVQRQTIADGMVRCLDRLGLERKAKRIPTLQDYLSQKGSHQT